MQCRKLIVSFFSVLSINVNKQYISLKWLQKEKCAQLHWCNLLSVKCVYSQVEISHRIAWRRTFSSSLHCDSSTISSMTLLGSPFDYLTCRVGCTGNLGTMQYFCTDFSDSEDWSAGERSYTYTFGSGVTYFEAS